MAHCNSFYKISFLGYFQNCTQSSFLHKWLRKIDLSGCWKWAWHVWFRKNPHGKLELLEFPIMAPGIEKCTFATEVYYTKGFILKEENYLGHVFLEISGSFGKNSRNPGWPLSAVRIRQSQWIFHTCVWKLNWKLRKILGKIVSLGNFHQSILYGLHRKNGFPPRNFLFLFKIYIAIFFRFAAWCQLMLPSLHLSKLDVFFYSSPENPPFSPPECWSVLVDELKQLIASWKNLRRGNWDKKQMKFSKRN